MDRRIIGGALALAVSGCMHHDGPSAKAGPVDPASPQSVGLGRYVTSLLPGEKPPSNRKGAVARPKVTESFQGPAPSNDWWSSLIWQYNPDNPYSEAMFPHPLALKAESAGLGLSYPTTPVVAAKSYAYPYARDLTISVDGLAAPDTRVASHSDWVVTASWKAGAKAMTATFGHGLPFVYVKKEGGDAAIELGTKNDGGDRVWSDHDGTVGVTVNGHHYGIFAPFGATWRRAGTRLTSTLEGADHFSVAVLPDATKETLELFRRHAFAFVKESQATWKYDVPTARLVTTYAVTTELLEKGHGYVDTPLMALYRHQWKSTTTPARSGT